MFPKLAMFVDSNKDLPLEQYSVIVQDLKDEFLRRFEDLSALESVFKFLVDPFNSEPLPAANALCFVSSNRPVYAMFGNL